VVRITSLLLFNGSLCCFSRLEIRAASIISPAENTGFAAIGKLGAKTPGVFINHNALRLEILTILTKIFHYQWLQLLIHNLERGVESIPSLCPSSDTSTGVSDCHSNFISPAKNTEGKEVRPSALLSRFCAELSPEAKNL